MSGSKVGIKKRMDILSHKIHGLKYKFKLDNGFDFESLRLPRKLAGVYTTTGKLSEEAFNKGIAMYHSFVEKDIEMVS